MNTSSLHKEKITKIAKQLKNYRNTNDARKIRFAHGSTNSTRVQDKSENYIIDISSLNEILTIDAKQKIAIVEPNVPMDMLVEECLAYNLLPKVVMEFPGITCGGGINGAALEASSYKYGQFNDTCLTYECILGDGNIVNASAKQNSDLFYGVSGSYGSLALVTAITISLIPAKPYVRLNFLPVSVENVVTELEKLVQEKTCDYLDAIIFDEAVTVIITGILTEDITHPLVSFTKAVDEWFYLYAKQTITQHKEITVPIKDFLFRYDRGAFWMGQLAFASFHTPFNRLMRTFLDSLMHTRVMYQALHKSNLAQELFVQDFYIPLSKTKDFIAFTSKHLGIFPLWLCPITSTKTSQYLSPHYLSEEMLIDVGIWGNIPAGTDSPEINKRFEKYVEKIGGRKMLYAEAFYTEESFWKIYNKEAYYALREKYNAEQIFPTVWEKTHVKKRYAVNKWKGALETITELFKKKLKKIKA